MDTTIHLGQVDIKPVDCVRDLGVLIDSSLNICQHVAKVTSTCFFHLRQLRRLSSILDIDARKRLVCALILTRIDYCNSALAGLPDSTLAPLQWVGPTARRRTVRSRLAATRPRHSCTADAPLAAGPSTSINQFIKSEKTKRLLTSQYKIHDIKYINTHKHIWFWVT